MVFSYASCDNNKANQPTTDEPSTIITFPSDDRTTDMAQEENEIANMKLTLKIK